MDLVHVSARLGFIKPLSSEVLQAVVWLGIFAKNCLQFSDSLLFGLFQLGVPLQHRHDGVLLLLSQVTQVNHACGFSQQAGEDKIQSTSVTPLYLLLKSHPIVEIKG